MAGSDPIRNATDLAGVDEPITVPSGQKVTLQDVVQDAPGPDGLTVRFRFVAPAIANRGGTVDVDQAMADMEYLCQTYALPRLSNTGPRPAQVVISLSDVAVPFGEPAPDATQYFEGYRVENDTCIWEAF
ncbi:MAG: DUF6497 family protein [Paracoccaceae bacterium]